MSIVITHHTNSPDGSGPDGRISEPEWEESHDLTGTLDDAQIPSTIARDTEVATAISDHAGLTDPHTGYRLESADHSHATTGLQGGTVAHSVLTGVSADQHHNQAHGNADHTTTGTPGSSAFGDAAAQGSSASVARLDHVHGREVNPVTAHEAASDPHTGYRLESADHSHASTGLQGGKIAQSASHESPDTDTGTSSLHHTIGAGANQASAGNHTHTAAFPTAVACRVTNSGTISSTSGNNIFMTFDTETYDQGGLHSTVTATGRLTAPSDGIYHIGAIISFAANTTSFRQVTIEKNANGVANAGTNVVTFKGAPSASGTTQIPLSGDINMVAGDYVEIWVTQSAATLAVTPQFWMHKTGN